MTTSDLPVAEPDTSATAWAEPRYVELFEDDDRIALVIDVPNDQVHRVVFDLSYEKVAVRVQASPSSEVSSPKEVYAGSLPTDAVLEEAALVYGDHAITVVIPRLIQAGLERSREEELLARHDEMLERLRRASTPLEIVDALGLSEEDVQSFVSTVDLSEDELADLTLLTQAIAARQALHVPMPHMVSPPSGLLT